MEYVEFFKHCPLLVPESLDPLRADGYVDVAEGVRVRITLDTASMGGIYCVDAVRSTPEIELFLRGKQHDLDIRLRQCTSALSFVKELQYILAGAPSDLPRRISPFYEQLIRECDNEIGWDCIVSFDEKAQLVVAKLERHNVYASFESETFSSDVEEGAVAMASTSLGRYLESLEEKCRRMAECWDLLDDVDSSLCVLQPPRPKRCDLWRRVAVGDLTTALVEAAPDRPCPRIVVYGPSSMADPLKARAKSARALWSSARGARANLEAILECTLPEPGSAGQSDIRLECGVCFEFARGAETADQLCGSDLCAQPFHRSCLAEWLATKEDTRQSFSTLFGRCPYCNGNVTVART